MSARNHINAIGYRKKGFLPKHGVQLGTNKLDLKTSNQMFFQWIQPKPTTMK